MLAQRDFIIHYIRKQKNLIKSQHTLVNTEKSSVDCEASITLSVLIFQIIAPTVTRFRHSGAADSIEHLPFLSF